MLELMGQGQQHKQLELSILCLENQTTNVVGKLSVDNIITTNNSVVNGSTIGLNKSSVGLGLVDNTADAFKPISTATQTELTK